MGFIHITDTEKIENDTNKDDQEENHTILDRIINGLENTISGIETNIGDLDESNYYNDAKEENIESEEQCNDEDEKQDKRPRGKYRSGSRTNATKFSGK